MAKPAYRLTSVLQIRLRAKEEAARLVATRRTQLVEAESELQRRSQAVGDCRSRIIAARDSMFETSIDGIEAFRLTEFRAHLAGLRQTEQELQQDLERQHEAVAHAEQELDKAIASLNEANKQANIIEKHREKWKREVQQGLRRREEKVSDEIGNILYERSRKLLRP